MTTTPAPSPLSASQLVDEYFIENRNRLIEIAAFLDRLDRTDPSIAMRDFRMRAFTEALGLLSAGQLTRVSDIQTLLSDPTIEPKSALDRKGAIGAWDRETPGAGA